MRRPKDLATLILDVVDAIAQIVVRLVPKK